MANNKLNTGNNILVKVDQNNLMFVDPNTVVSNGEISPRDVQPENLAMYVNLEADLIPRTILVSGNDRNTLTSIAKGTFNLMSNNGDDFDTSWTNSYTEIKEKTVKEKGPDGKSKETGTGDFFQSDSTGQSFGMESVNIEIKGANAVPRVLIKFIDVRGKTLFESPENSPYKAFFHLPWPIFYLTVKGFYGKAIRYRLHLVKFNSRYNSSNGNFEIDTQFIGSTHAYLSDIPLEGILDAPYMFLTESTETAKFNEGTGLYDKKIKKTTKGYTILKSVYQEYINKGLLPKDFPVRTLREVVVIAGRLNQILERELFSKIIDHKVLASIKGFEDTITTLEGAIINWKSKHLSAVYEEDDLPTTRPDGSRYFKKWFEQTGDKKNELTYITGSTVTGTLETIITTATTKLDQNEAFGVNRNKKLLRKLDFDIHPVSFGRLRNLRSYYTVKDKIRVDIEGLLDSLYDIQRDFVEQRNKLENNIEKKMNDIVKRKDIGIGFEPTIRNIVGVILANADAYIRLLKDVHYKAFESAEVRKELLKNISTDSVGDSIYPWPEVKKQTAGGKNSVLVYPGSRDMVKKLNSSDKKIWPEVDFVENYYQVTTKKTDPLAEKEGNPDNINFIFETDTDILNKRDISVFSNLTTYVPYFDKSIASILYEIYERAKYNTTLSPFSNNTIQQLAEIEFKNLKAQIEEDYDVIDILKGNIKDIVSLKTYMKGFSAFDRWPYYQDQLPTVTYIKDTIEQDFVVEKYTQPKNNLNFDGEYDKLAYDLNNYKPENHRLAMYPFNSPTYMNYLGITEYKDSELLLNNMLQVKTTDGFITSLLDGKMWVKNNYKENIFTQYLDFPDISGNTISKHILNTPYFHKQLFKDFTKVGSKEKYVGSSYLLLNSLPFVDLDDTMVGDIKLSFGTFIPNINIQTKEVRVSTVLKEIGASHYIPYHLMLKWGSIYHRYKKFITEGIDIISGCTEPININSFYDALSGRTYNVYSGVNVTPNSDNFGFYPFYHSVFHQIVNGYTFYNHISGSTSYQSSINSRALLSESQAVEKGVRWTSWVDNSKFDSTDERYTILPSNGRLYLYNDSSNFEHQQNLRIIWDADSLPMGEGPINFSGLTLPAHNNYHETVTGKYSISSNYKKILDLIAVFKPEILDTFEDAFLHFSSEKLNEEIVYKPYDVKYWNFQDLLKEIVSVKKGKNDAAPTAGANNFSYLNELAVTVKKNQTENLKTITNSLTSDENLIKITISNPREINPYVLGGFTGVDSQRFSVDIFRASQLANNLDNIKLFLGEDVDGDYQDFFINNNVEISEENIKQFRSLIYMYGGLTQKNKVDYKKTNPLDVNYTGFTKPSKSVFIAYLKENLISGPVDGTTRVSKMTDRLNLFLTTLISKIQSKDLEAKKTTNVLNIVNGYNDDPIKLELYNYFKSFNDKWVAGNSIGQRGLLEEFLFIDKANKDIGDKVFLDMERLLGLINSNNKKINLYSALSLLIQDTGFDMRALPAYVNFYGTNFTNKKKIEPTKKVAESLFGTFLEVDYQESSPKIILQYIGPTSKHLELSDINKKYKYKDDSFNISDPNNNPVLIANENFLNTDFSKANKVVAFEVSFGDQNQSMFKSVQLDQSSIKNTSESFKILERLGASESGSSTAQVDIGLFDIYRQSSYTCDVTSMGNVMIQPTMYFYLKNIPMFRGSYWITEVSHSIKIGNIETTFKGTRIPIQSLPNPEDSFLASYRALFDKLVKKAVARVSEENQQLANAKGTEKVIQNDKGSFTIDMGVKETVKGEKLINMTGLKEYGIPFNGQDGEKYIQLISYNDDENNWLRATVAQMGGKNYKIEDNIVMSFVSKMDKTIDTATTLKWLDIKDNGQQYYSTKFNVGKATPDFIVTKFGSTEFLNPLKNVRHTLKTNINVANKKYEGPVNIGPAIEGYGIGMSKELMNKLQLSDGDVVYFRLI